jgi:DNA repair protein RecO (recombination protein O)
MTQYQTEAILLTARDWSGADRMVTLFSTEYGKISAIAYGVRGGKSRLAGSLQPFAHVEVALQPGKTIDTIKQCEIKQSFRELREDLGAMAYGSFLTEIVTELWPEREADPAVFELLLGAFELLRKRNPRIVALAAAWQLMALAGFRPQMNQCAVCGEAVSLPAGFDVQAGGCVCTRCGGPSCADFTASHKMFVEQLLNLHWEEPGHFTVNSIVLSHTERLLNAFLSSHLEKPLKSISFIQLVNQTPKS